MPEHQTRRNNAKPAPAFATPTIVHFSFALLLAAVQTAPWRVVGPVTVIWGLLGLIGIVYEIIVARHMLVQKMYKPVFEDWLFHAFLPFIAYAALTVSAFLTRVNVSKALFVTSAAVLLMLFIGIHNAWDAVTYLVFSAQGEHGKTE